MHKPLRSSNSRSPQLHTAFTLIELLVVIAIFAMLAAILFPVFGRARDNARRTTCQSNMRQIGLGAMQYSSDYDDFTVLCNYVDSPRGQSYAESLQPYLKSTQIFICPTDTSDKQCISVNGFRLSYALNNIYEKNPPLRIFDASAPKNMAYVESPAETIFIGDSIGQGGADEFCFQVIGDNFNVGPPALLGGPGGIVSGENQGLFEGRHFNGVNWAFMDGHVKWMRFQQVSELSTKENNGSPAGSFYRYFTPQDD